MRGRRCLTVCAAALALCAAPTSAPLDAQAASSPALTMGRLAVMSASPDATLATALLTALNGSDAGLRFVAARLTRTLKMPGLEPALRRELAVEQNPAVALEMMRALLVLDTATSRAAVEESLGTDPRRVLAHALWLARMAPESLIERLPAYARVLPGERDLSSVVQLAISQHPNHRSELLRIAQGAAPSIGWDAALARRAEETASAGTRTFDSPWPGLIASVLSEVKCSVPGQMEIGGLAVRFRPDGRVQSGQLVTARLYGGCQQALRPLLQLLVAADDEPVDSTNVESILVPVQRAALACLDAAQPGGDAALRRSDVPKEAMPTVKRSEEPRYPEAESQANRGGSVEMAARLSPTGCVSHLRVVRSVSPALDLEAIVTGFKWQFNPARIEGRPVAVWVTLILEFRLSR